MKEKRFPTVEQLPPYQLSRVTQRMIEERRRGKDVINLGMGNPDLPPPQAIVNKLIEATGKPHNHRYSISRGIPSLRKAIGQWYERRFNVVLNPESEVVTTMGAKEGIAHLMLAICKPGDVVLAPDPSYPIHTYGAVIAGAKIHAIRSNSPDQFEENFLKQLENILKSSRPRAKALILGFPANPTTQVVDLDFLSQVIALAKQHDIMVIHDLAYADLTFDGYKAPSILQVPGAKQVAVEVISLSKSFSIAGWRIGFVCGNPEMVGALTRLKNYLDYGIFQPLQIAATVALNHSEEYIQEVVSVYQRRRDILCRSLNQAGWPVSVPRATMFVWAKIPPPFVDQGSLAFSTMLFEKACVAVTPGIGFGKGGEGYVRFALVENYHRIWQAVRNIKKCLNSCELRV